MTFYVKTEKELKEQFNHQKEFNFYTLDEGISDYFTADMACFCGQKKLFAPLSYGKTITKKRWFTYAGYQWHISWLRYTDENGQYLLDFEGD